MAVGGRRLTPLARHSSLSGVQREQVRGILERRRPERERRMAEMFETCGQGVLADQEALEAEIRPLLHAEQQAHFDAFVQRHRRFHSGPR